MPSSSEMANLKSSLSTDKQQPASGGRGGTGSALSALRTDNTRLAHFNDTGKIIGFKLKLIIYTYFIFKIYLSICRIL